MPSPDAGVSALLLKAETRFQKILIGLVHAVSFWAHGSVYCNDSKTVPCFPSKETEGRLDRKLPLKAGSIYSTNLFPYITLEGFKHAA